LDDDGLAVLTAEELIALVDDEVLEFVGEDTAVLLEVAAGAPDERVFA